MPFFQKLYLLYLERSQIIKDNSKMASDLIGLESKTKTEEHENDIFLSFHPDILKHVETIHEKLLKRYKFKIWPRVINSNNSEQADLVKVVKNATIFLCFVTQKYCESAKCLKEIELAERTHATIIFAVVEKIENENLGSLEVFLKKAPISNVLKCYNSEGDWWIDQFDHVKELILEVKIINCIKKAS